MPFYPGPGLGGHCIPIDPFYLTWKSREYEATTRFIELAGEINVSMPEYVLQKILLTLNEAGKSRITSYNVCYTKLLRKRGRRGRKKHRRGGVILSAQLKKRFVLLNPPGEHHTLRI